MNKNLRVFVILAAVLLLLSLGVGCSGEKEAPSAEEASSTDKDLGYEESTLVYDAESSRVKIVTLAEIISNDFENTQGFRDGLVSVTTYTPDRSRSFFSFLDKTGAVVLKTGLGDKCYAFNDGLAPIEFDDTTRHLGYIDQTGKVIAEDLRVAGSFSEGLAYVSADGLLYGYIDASVRMALPAVYKRAKSFSEGLAAVSLDGMKFGYIDQTGATVIPFEYSSDAEPFSEGLALVSKGGVYEYIDKTGRTVISAAEYANPESFSEGLAAVKRDGKYGYINTAGEVVIPFEYRTADPFSEGLAKVTRDVTGPSLYIDQTGKVIISLRSSDMGSSFSHGLAMVRRDRRYGFIDQEGIVAIPFDYEYASDFSDDGLTILAAHYADPQKPGESSRKYSIVEVRSGE